MKDGIKRAVFFVVIAGLYGADSLPEALQSKRYQDALAFTEALLARQPNDPKTLTAHGMALEGLGRVQESIDAFEKALKFAPQFVPALQGAIEVTYRARNPKAAVFLGRLIQIKPQDEVAHAMAGVLAFEADNCIEAIQHFERAMKQILNNEQAYPLYGACLLKTARPLEALKVFERLLAKSPDSASVLNRIASAEAASGQWEPAVGHLRKAASLAPDDDRNYLDLAAIYIQRNALDAATEVVDIGLKNSPGSARLYSIRGIIHAQGGRIEEAVADFDLANRLDAGQDYGAAGLGILYTETKRADLALPVLRDRLKHAPKDFMLNYLLAQAVMDEPVEPATPQFEEAKQALEASIQANPDFTKSHTLLGKLYAQVGENQQALQELKLGNQKDRMTLSQLAIVLRRLDRTDEAAQVLLDLKQVIIHESEGKVDPQLRDLHLP